MKNKFLKSIASVVAVVMLMSMVPAVVSAETATISNVNVEISKTENGKIVTVTADVTGLTEFTLLAVRDNAEYASLEDLPSDVVEEGAAMSDLEKQVEYIDQPEISGTALSYTFPLRDREGDLAMEAADCYINVFLGGAGASAVVAAAIEKLDAPAIAVEDPADKYYVEDENVVVTYEFANDEAEAIWEAKTLEVKIGDEVLEDLTWDFPGNNVKIPAASFDAASYTNAVITIAEADDATFYTATAAAVTFTVASRVEEAKDAIQYLAVEYDENGTDASITIPAIDPVAGVTISYEVTGYEPEDGVIAITRPAEGEAEVVIEYKVVLTYKGEVIDETEKSLTVKPVGVDRYTIVADDVTLSTTAFGIANAKVATVKIGKDDIDPTAQTVAINGETMFYVPERSTGDVYTFVAIARTNNASTADIAAVAEIVDEAATAIYYGKVSNPVNNTKLIAADVARALAMFKANEYSDAYTDQQYLSADVIGNGQVKAPQVARLLATFKSTGSTDKSGFNILAN